MIKKYNNVPLSPIVFSIEVHIVDSDIIQIYAYIGGKQYFPDIEKRPIIKTDRFV